jgi:hypothetical protein
MGRRFIAAAGEIEIDDRVGVDHAQTVEALRRQIDMRARRRGSREEHALALDEGAMFFFESWKLFGHDVAPIVCRPVPGS